MAAVASTATRVMAGSYSLSPVVTSVTPTWSQAMLDVTSLADTAMQYIPGTTNETLTLQGWLDPTSTSNLQYSQQTTWLAGTAGIPVSYAPRGFTQGREVLMLSALTSKLQLGASAAGVVQFSQDFQQDGGIDYGVAIRDLSADTSSTNGAGLDNGAATANGGVAHLHVTAYSGFTNVVIKVQTSTDNVTFGTDLVTFSTVTGLTYQRSTVAAATTVARYMRIASTVTGTGSITYSVSFARR